ncbi:hypothetical protein GCM10027575_86210 [Phytohabitans suffuscus]
MNWEISSREPTMSVPLVTIRTAPTMTVSLAQSGGLARPAAWGMAGSDRGAALRQRNYVRLLKEP